MPLQGISSRMPQLVILGLVVLTSPWAVRGASIAPADQATAATTAASIDLSTGAVNASVAPNVTVPFNVSTVANITFSEDELMDSEEQSHFEGTCILNATCAAHCRQRRHASGHCDAKDQCVCRELKQKGRCMALAFGCGITFPSYGCNGGGNGGGGNGGSSGGCAGCGNGGNGGNGGSYPPAYGGGNPCGPSYVNVPGMAVPAYPAIVSMPVGGKSKEHTSDQ